MLRPTLTTLTRKQNLPVSTLGNSLTYSPSNAVPISALWPTLLQNWLQGQGVRAMNVNCGISGSKTTAMNARKAGMLSRGTPILAVLEGGVNDPFATTGTALAGSATTIGLASGAGQGTDGSFVGQVITITSGTGSGSTGTITAYNGRTDTATVASWSGTAPAAGSGYSVAALTGAQTQANLTAIVQSLLTAGCPRVLVLNTPYKNFSSGGDTTTTPEPTYATLRTFQAAAVASFASSNPGQVALVDLYAFMRAIVAGTAPAANANGVATGGSDWVISGNQVKLGGTTYTIAQGDNQWHAAANDQHFNALGNFIVSVAVLSALQAQSGWLTAMQSL